MGPPGFEPGLPAPQAGVLNQARLRSLEFNLLFVFLGEFFVIKF